MSLERMLDRVVTVQRRVVTGVDGRGNDVIGNGTATANVRAARELVGADEDLSQRDQQTRTFRYFLEPKPAGVALVFTGYDRIVDTDGTFEVKGAPETMTRRRRQVVHHLEAMAYETKG